MTSRNKHMPRATASNVEYSRLSHTLDFSISVNAEMIRMAEDSMNKEGNPTFAEVADYLAEQLSRIVLLDYHRGGLRRTDTYPS